MGNRNEEDYNFVFKGESGSVGKEERLRETQEEHSRARGPFLFFNHLAGPTS